MIYRKQLRTSQPQTAPQIDWGNPLARELVVWIDGNSFFIPASQNRSVNISTRGGSVKGFVTGGGVYTFATTPISTTELTVLGEAIVGSTGGYQAMWAIENSSGTSSFGVMTSAYPSTNFGLDVRPYASDTNSTQPIIAGTPVMIGGTVSVSANKLSGYYNGQLSYSSTLASSASTSYERVNLFAKRGGLDAASSNSKINWIAFWKRALSAQEIASLYDNPYQLFKKQSLKLFFTVSSTTQTLTPSLFTNSNTFYSATVTAGAVTLTPSLFTNSNTFYSATVTPGAVTLTPGLYTNTNTFYSATVTPGAVTLTPDLFTNTNSFYSPTVTAGAITLTPALFTNTNTFYSAIVSQGGVILQPDLYTNTNSFYSATVTVGAVTLTPGLFTNTNSFYSATVTSTVTLTPDLYTNGQTFYAPTVTQGAAAQTLAPDLFTNTNVFYSPTVAPGTVTLTPDLYQNTNAFYSPTVVQATEQTILPDLFVNTNIFFQPTVDDGTRVISIADVGAEDERRKKRQKKRDKEFALLKQEQDKLRQEIERVIDPVVEKSQPVIVSPADREVRVLSVAGNQVAVTVPESLDVAQVAREIAQIFEQSRIKATIVERAAQTQQALAQAQEEYRRKIRRRRDDELLLLMD